MTKSEKTLLIVAVIALLFFLIFKKTAVISEDVGAMPSTPPWYMIYNLPGSMIANAANIISPTMPSEISGQENSASCSVCSLFPNLVNGVSL